MADMIDADRFVRFVLVDDVRETSRGLEASLHDERLRLELVRADVIRVTMSRAGRFEDSPTYAVCVDPLAEPVPFEVERTEDRVRLVTEAMSVTLWLDPFRLDIHRADGSAVVETAADGEGNYWTYATSNDAFMLRRRCRREDAFYGLGEKAGRLDKQGREFTMWNLDVLSPPESAEFTSRHPAGDPRADRTSAEMDPYYVNIPLLYHCDYPAGAVAGSFVDNGFRGHYDFTDGEQYTIDFSGGQYTEYIFAGPEIPDILATYTWLTGRMQPPPLWSLGYHQCRWFDYTESSMLQLAAEHREHEIPCDALWLDISYMDGYRVFTWHPERFPDPPVLLEALAEQGFRVITIIDPGVKRDPGYAVFDAGRSRDLFCKTEAGDTYLGQVWPGNTAFPDFVLEEAREWWGELNAAHVRSGLAGIWNDMNEPATGAIPPFRMLFGAGRYSHERYHNQYALLMAMSTTHGLLAAMPALRTFVLSRSGFAGIQRYAANWLGDNQARWDHLWVSMPMAMGFGLSGQPFLGADVGGFQGNTHPELFLRWMQYGTLTPFFRNHSEIGNVDQYAWSFGSVIEDLVRDAIRLRYRLLPYLYAAFLVASETGAPVQRPLVFDHQRDATVRDIDDEYLLGPDLLVAPVITPGATARQVYLPAGSWYDLHAALAGHPVDPVGGRRFLTVPTPMESIPVFARGGAVVPMWTDAPESTAGYAPVVVELHLFVPESDGNVTSMLQEDDGLTFAALAGARLRTTLTVTRTGSRLRLSATVEGNGFPEFRREAFSLVVHGAFVEEVRLDGEQIAASPAGSFRLPRAGLDFNIELQLG
jgi:alpha-glucosidase